MSEVVALSSVREPRATAVVRVIETEDGDLVVTASDGMERSQIIGHLLLAAVHMASK